jgi:hypothetical protein
MGMIYPILGTMNRIGDAIARLGAPHDGRHDLRRALAEGAFGGVDRRIAGGEARGEVGLIH